MAQEAPARAKIPTTGARRGGTILRRRTKSRSSSPMPAVVASWAHRACAGPQAVAHRIDIG
jgi:hypothetical protein